MLIVFVFAAAKLHRSGMYGVSGAMENHMSLLAQLTGSCVAITINITRLRRSMLDALANRKFAEMQSSQTQ